MFTQVMLAALSRPFALTNQATVPHSAPGRVLPECARPTGRVPRSGRQDKHNGPTKSALRGKMDVPGTPTSDAKTAIAIARGVPAGNPTTRPMAANAEACQATDAATAG